MCQDDGYDEFWRAARERKSAPCSSPLLSVDAVTLGEQPFGTSHWAGTWNGFPAVSLSHYGGATLFYFAQQWKKIAFRSLAQLHEVIGVDR